MKKVLLVLVALLLIGSASIAVFSSQTKADSFNQNNLMDNAVFDDSNSMTTTQIQSFLNSFPNSCLANYSAPYPSNYFTYGPDAPASAIIKQTATTWGISPKVILATLEKEESLVTGNIGCAAWQYNSAVGMGCPDGGVCPSPAYAGFSKQVMKGMWQLKFSKERAEGNVTWDGDGDIQYYGYMTAGTRARIQGGATAYYDGTANIDGVLVSMTTSATAALYTYTPHFHGNQNFVTIFNKWFGSTQFPQPLGASIDQSQTTGSLYLIDTSTATPTKYLIPDWLTMQNYGLDAYPALSTPESSLSAMTDGGNLTNLIYDTGGVYLVNNTTRLPVSASSCVSWGFICSDSSQVKGLNTDFQTQYLKRGSTLTDVATSNGVTYKMSAGKKQPVANQKTLTDLGLSNVSPITTSASNSNQKLGQLLMTTPNVVKFSPSQTIYYYNGTQYFAVPDMDTFNSLGLSYIQPTPVPVSSYNGGDIVPSTPLNYWAQDASGNRYVVNNGQKIPLSTDQQKYWANATYTTGLDGLLSQLPTNTLGGFIKSGVDYYQLSPNSSDKHYITSIPDYYALGGNSQNTTYLNQSIGNQINTGLIAFPDGSLLKVGSDPSIYVMNQGKLIHIPSMSILYAYNFNTSRVIVYPQATAYIVGSVLTIGSLADGTITIPYNNSLYTLTSAQVVAYGLVVGTLTTPITQQFVSSATQGKITNLMRNSDNGSIYYASNGSLHHIQSMDIYKQLGGGSTPLTAVNSQIINLFNIGSDV